MDTRPKIAILINIIVTLSNLAAIPAIIQATSYPDRAISIFVMVASMLMHISERKHKLPGIPPFNKWSYQLEMVDKSAAWIAGAYFIYNNVPLLISNYPLVIFGLLMITLAERVAAGYMFFMVTHLLWHFSVYRMIFLFVTAK
jgi:hypothetical protein